MFLNYPNNPTGAIAPLDFYERCVALARRHDFIICSDAAYSEMYYDEGDRPHSILEVPGAKQVCVEMHSLSKTFNMTGWRLAFAVGSADVLAALAKVKGNMDSGAFNAIQEAGATALHEIERSEIVDIRRTYKERRDLLVAGLARAGFGVRPPRPPRSMSGSAVRQTMIPCAARPGCSKRPRSWPSPAWVSDRRAKATCDSP